MKRYAAFVARFALAPMISGTFVVSTGWPATLIEWAHVVLGAVMVYLILALLLRALVHHVGRLPAVVSLLLALAMLLPGFPQFHAALSPILFAALVWAALANRLAGEPRTRLGWKLWMLPVLVLLAIYYGVGYRHQTSGIFAHIGVAMTAAGFIVGFCMYINEKYPEGSPLRAVTGLTITAVLFQVVAGVSALVIRMLDRNGGLALGLARTAHFVGAGLVLGACVMLLRTRMFYPAGQPFDLAEQPAQSRLLAQTAGRS